MYDQTLFASVQQAFDLGAVAVGATVYYGSLDQHDRFRGASGENDLAQAVRTAVINKRAGGIGRIRGK